MGRKRNKREQQESDKLTTNPQLKFDHNKDLAFYEERVSDEISALRQDDSIAKKSPSITAKKRKRLEIACIERKVEDSSKYETQESKVASKQSWLPLLSFISRGANTSRDNVVSYEQQQHSLEELDLLSCQLNKIKRQLWPAAVRASQRLSSSLHGNKSAVTPKKMFYMARRMCNPYEHLDHLTPERVSFMNRSALKLANINALFDFTLIPQTSNTTFTFADLCGAPGGFSEYLLYFCNHVRNIPSAKGYGMSLLGTNQHGTGFQWNLPRPVADGTFQIIQGSDGSGDIYNWDNIQFLKEFIENDTTKDQPQRLTNKESNSSLCDLVVADGGLDAQRESEIQEYLTFELLVNQVAAALLLLNHGGNFVLKFFGSENYETRLVMQYLYAVFDRISVVKPIISRPASAERYLVCFGYKTNNEVTELWNAKDWRDHMLSVASNNGTQEGLASNIQVALDPKLEDYLNTINHEIFLLNIKACGDIISMLDDMTDVDMAPQFCDTQPNSDGEFDMKGYQLLWKLNGREPMSTL